MPCWGLGEKNWEGQMPNRCTLWILLDYVVSNAIMNDWTFVAIPYTKRSQGEANQFKYLRFLDIKQGDRSQLTSNSHLFPTPPGDFVANFGWSKHTIHPIKVLGVPVLLEIWIIHLWSRKLYPGISITYPTFHGKFGTSSTQKCFLR